MSETLTMQQALLIVFLSTPIHVRHGRTEARSVFKSGSLWHVEYSLDLQQHEPFTDEVIRPLLERGILQYTYPEGGDYLKLAPLLEGVAATGGAAQ